MRGKDLIGGKIAFGNCKYTLNRGKKSTDKILKHFLLNPMLIIRTTVFSPKITSPFYPLLLCFYKDKQSNAKITE